MYPFHFNNISFDFGNHCQYVTPSDHHLTNKVEKEKRNARGKRQLQDAKLLTDYHHSNDVKIKVAFSSLI